MDKKLLEVHKGVTYIDCFDNVDLLDLLDQMTDFSIFATSLKADKYIEQLDDITGNVAVIFGNEGSE